MAEIVGTYIAALALVVCFLLLYFMEGMTDVTKYSLAVVAIFCILVMLLLHGEDSRED